MDRKLDDQRDASLASHLVALWGVAMVRLLAVLKVSH